MSNLAKKVFIICPVREIVDEEKRFLENYVLSLESQGYKVHYPTRDTFQNDPIGLDICSQNREAIQKSDEVHVYWNSKSQGSKFDFGMAFGLKKPIKLINPQDVRRTPYKSFENVLLELHSKYKLF